MDYVSMLFLKPPPEHLLQEAMGFSYNFLFYRLSVHLLSHLLSLCSLNDRKQRGIG